MFVTFDCSKLCWTLSTLIIPWTLIFELWIIPTLKFNKLFAVKRVYFIKSWDAVCCWPKLSYDQNGLTDTSVIILCDVRTEKRTTLLHKIKWFPWLGRFLLEKRELDRTRDFKTSHRAMDYNLEKHGFRKTKTSHSKNGRTPPVRCHRRIRYEIRSFEDIAISVKVGFSGFPSFDSNISVIRNSFL